MEAYSIRPRLRTGSSTSFRAGSLRPRGFKYCNTDRSNCPSPEAPHIMDWSVTAWDNGSGEERATLFTWGWIVKAHKRPWRCVSFREVTKRDKRLNSAIARLRSCLAGRYG